MRRIECDDLGDPSAADRKQSRNGFGSMFVGLQPALHLVVPLMQVSNPTACPVNDAPSRGKRNRHFTAGVPHTTPKRERALSLAMFLMRV